ncbi:MAG: 30S ribosome-binding factor RbfA [Candidatus Zixiibacteriota bacterium]
MAVKQYKRSDRLAEQILRDISSLLAQELADKMPGLVTFTHVRLSDDLRYATVYYSYLGDQAHRDKLDGYLIKENKRIRSLVGRNLRVRTIPEFRFKFDPSIEEGIRIEQLLNEIRNERKDT